MTRNDILNSIAEQLEDARAEAEKIGLAEGRAQGIAQGIAQGMAQGMAQGLAEGRADAVRKMLTAGFPPEKIADIMGMSQDDIIEISKS